PFPSSDSSSHRPPRDLRNDPRRPTFVLRNGAPWPFSMRIKTARHSCSRQAHLATQAESVTDLTHLGDESLRRAYEQIRDELMADARSAYRFMGAAAKTRAEVLFTEIRRRG